MPIETIKKGAEWFGLNILSAVYVVKEWIMLNVGVAINSELIQNETWIDVFIKWAIGITIVVFNILRIYKYFLDIQEKKRKAK